MPGGPGPLQYLAQTIVKVGFVPPKYLKKGLKGFRKLGAPNIKSLTRPLQSIKKLEVSSSKGIRRKGTQCDPFYFN